MSLFLQIAPDTFRTVQEELYLFGGSILLGIPAGLITDLFRLFRRMIPHRSIAAALEDIFTLILISFLLLCYTSAFAGGRFRVYYAVGCLAGWILYECTMGFLLMKCFDLIIAPFRWIWHRIVCICIKIRKKFVKYSEKSRHVKKNAKNSLHETPHKVYNNNYTEKCRSGKK